MRSIDIAVHLLKKSIKLGQNDSNYYMDFIKLHKLMFLAQCYLNFEYNLDLFDDKITANDDGPYVDGLNSVPAICGFDIIKNIDDLMVHLHHIMPCHLAHILPLPLLRGETLDLILDVFGKCDTYEIVKISKNTTASQHCYSKAHNNVINQEILRKTGQEISKTILSHQEQNGSILIKKLTLPKNQGNK